MKVETLLRELLILTIWGAYVLGDNSMENYHIGLFFPFSSFNRDTGLPEQASDGLFQTNFLQVSFAVAAVELFNARDGSVLPILESLPCNVTLNYSIYDTSGDYTPALKQFMTFQDRFSDEIDQSRMSIVGPQYSSVAVPLSFVSSVQKIPLISYAATSIELDNADSFPYFFRTIPSDAITTKVIAEFLSSQSVPYAAVLYMEDSYGNSYKDALVANAAMLGVSLLAFGYDYAVVGSFDAILESIKRTGLNIFVALVFQDRLKELMLAAQELGLTGDGKLWIFGDAIGSGQNVESDAETSQLFLKAINGSVQILPEARDTDSTTYQNLIRRIPSFDFQDQLQAQLPGFNNYAGYNFGNFTVPTMASGLYSSLSTDEAVCDFCLFAFDAVVAAAYAASTACTSEESVVATLASADFEFEGASGAVRFNPLTHSRKLDSARYSLLQITFSSVDSSSLVFAKQGSFTGTWISSSALVIPRFASVSEVLTNDVSKSVRRFTRVMAIACIIFGFLCSSWVNVNAAEQVLKASQPIFLHLMVIGIVISSASVFFRGFNPDDVGFNITSALASSKEVVVEDTTRSDLSSLGAFCTTSWWFVSIGLTLTNTAFIVKLFRIVEVFNAAAHFKRETKTTTKELASSTGAIILFNLFCLSIWSFISPVKYVETVETTDQFGQATSVARKCTLSHQYDTNETGLATFMIIILFMFHVFQYVIGLYLCYQSRNLPSDFQEARWLMIAFFTEIQLIILGAAIIFAIDDNDQTVLTLVLSMLTILINVSILIMVFIPKMLRLRYGAKEVSLETPTK